MIEFPVPGSHEAVLRGCRCAVIDNHHGLGYHGQPGVFVISGNCPLHGFDAPRLTEADLDEDLRDEED